MRSSKRVPEPCPADSVARRHRHGALAMSTDDPARWIFEHLDDDRWRWQFTRTDRYPIRPTRTHNSLPAAIAEAIAQGFSPQNDRWIVDDHTYITHYEPGKNPETISKPDATKRPN